MRGIVEGDFGLIAVYAIDDESNAQVGSVGTAIAGDSSLWVFENSVFLSRDVVEIVDVVKKVVLDGIADEK